MPIKIELKSANLHEKDDFWLRGAQFISHFSVCIFSKLMTYLCHPFQKIETYSSYEQN